MTVDKIIIPESEPLCLIHVFTRVFKTAIFTCPPGYDRPPLGWDGLVLRGAGLSALTVSRAQKERQRV